MNICYPVQRSYPDHLTGSEIYIHDLARYFSNSNRITVLATGRRRDPPVPGSEGGANPAVQIFRSVDLAAIRLPLRYALSRDPTGWASQFISLPVQGLLHTATYGYLSFPMLAHLNVHRYDVVHAAAVPIPTTWAAWRSSSTAGFGFVLSPFLHLADREIYLPYVSRMLRGATHLIAATETEKRYLLSLGIDADSVSVIPPWIDIGGYQLGVARRFRGKFRIGESEFVLVIPRKAETKGAFHTLEALVSLGKAGVRVTCVLLGTARRIVQRQVDEYSKRLSRLGIRVVDVGYLPLDEMHDVLAGSNLLVEPSRADSFGMIYQDAWMHSLPVVAARIGAVPDVVHDGENGILVTYGSTQQIMQAIRALVLDSSLGRTLGRSGHSSVQELYDSRRLAPQIRAVYESAARSANQE